MLKNKTVCSSATFISMYRIECHNPQDQSHNLNNHCHHQGNLKIQSFSLFQTLLNIHRGLKSEIKLVTLDHV